MITVARVLARVAGALLLLAFAVAGLGLVAFSFGTGDATLSLGGLAGLLDVPAARTEIDAFLHALEAGGPTDLAALAGGAAAIVLGLLLVAGSVLPPRERLVVVERDDRGDLALRRRAARAQAESA